jgi:hypothetical protein
VIFLITSCAWETFRKMIPVMLESGARVIAPDFVIHAVGTLLSERSSADSHHFPRFARSGR